MLQHVLTEQFRLLVFRDVSFDIERRFTTYLAYVLVVSWLVGIGRYWDHPNAYAWQYAGLGSVAYVFVLSIFLYFVIKPIKPPRWSYRMVFVFVGFTSLPAVLYAIPVERFLTLDIAQKVNAWFLGIVAFWRVALYVRFLRKAAGLGKFGVFIAALLPLSVIVVTLSILNLEHVIFDLMAGIRDQDQSQNDVAYMVVFFLSVFAYMVFPVTAICYGIEIFRRKKRDADWP